MNWNVAQPKEKIESVMNALKANGIDADFVTTKEEAKDRVLSLIPKGSEVMTMVSETLRLSGIDDALKQSKDSVYLKDKLYAMEDGEEKRKIGAAPEYAVGSVHAVTEKGSVLIASNSGSQLPAYINGARQVIWVVGSQKIVSDTEEGLKRIYEHTLPLESERARKAYGVDGSNVSKIAIIHKELQPGRLKLIFINDAVGF